MTLSVGKVVLYENDSTPLLAVLLADNGGRFRVLNQNGSELSLPTARLHPSELSVPADGAKLESLLKLRAQVDEITNSISVRDLWEAQVESPLRMTASELAVVYFGTPAALHELAMLMALLSDPVYFKRELWAFEPRAVQAVEQQLKLEAARRERESRSHEFLSCLVAKTKDRTVPWPAETLTLVRIVEDIAAENPDLAGERLELGVELLRRAKQVLALDKNLSHERLAAELLDMAGHFDQNTNLALFRYRPPLEFKPEALTEVEVLSVEPSAGLREERSDLTDVATFTIDDESTQDMDDALSIEETSSGYRVGIHITDVAAVVPVGGALDSDARRRATSLYLPERTVPMLPRALSEARCSLIRGVPRPAVSCILELDRSFATISSTVLLSVINVKERLSYDEVDRRLHTNDRAAEQLFAVASHSEGSRIAQGAFKMAKHEALPVIDHDGTIRLEQVDEEAPAHFLVSELMVMANRTFAEFAFAKKVPILYRTQEAPEQASEEDEDDESPPDGHAADFAQRGKMKRSVMTPHASSHSMLGLRLYTQMTSPIRRYADLCNQRQIEAHLIGAPLPYSTERLGQLADQLETPSVRATHLSRESRRFWLLRYIEQEMRKGVVELDATVVRNDLKVPIVLLDKIFITCPFKMQPRPKLGAVMRVRVDLVHPRSGTVRLAVV